jgi:hypothetical protein
MLFFENKIYVDPMAPLMLPFTQKLGPPSKHLGRVSMGQLEEGIGYLAPCFYGNRAGVGSPSLPFDLPYL